MARETSGASPAGAAAASGAASGAARESTLRPFAPIGWLLFLLVVLRRMRR